MNTEPINEDSQRARDETQLAAPVPARDQKRAKRKIMRGHQITLANLVTNRQPNTKHALFVLAYITAWGVYVETHEGQWPPSTRQLGLASGMPLRNLDRWKQLFDETFPEYDSPKELWAVIREQVNVEEQSREALPLIVGAVVLP